MSNYSLGPVENMFPITPGTPYNASIRGIWVGGAGDIVGYDKGGHEVKLANVAAGTLLPIAFASITATSAVGTTTATGLVGLG